MAENGTENGSSHNAWIGEKGPGAYDLRSKKPLHVRVSLTDLVQAIP